MSPIPQGTGLHMPRGLVAEVEKERYDLWAARASVPAALWPTKRISLSGGPFADWAWDAALLPDRFLADGGEYRPTLTTPDDGVYVWAAFERWG